MILTCNNCDAKFNVNDEAIGVNGRNVKCSNCEFEWFQKPDVQVESRIISQPNAALEELKIQIALATQEPKPPVMAAPITQSISESELGATLPKNAPNSPSSLNAPSGSFMTTLLKVFILLAIPVLVVIMGIVHKSDITKKFPQFERFYDVIGLNSASDIKFQLIDCTLRDEGQSASGKTVELDVKVIIKNTGPKQQDLNTIRFSTYTKDRVFLGEFVMKVGKIIMAGNTEVIEGVLNRVPKDVAFVIIEVGNTLDLKLRSAGGVLKN